MIKNYELKISDSLQKDSIIQLEKMQKELADDYQQWDELEAKQEG